MQHSHRIPFGIFFWVGIAHLLCITCFFFARVPLRNEYKPMIVKSFSVPVAENSLPAQPLSKTPFIEEEKEVSSKEPIQESKKELPIEKIKSAPPIKKSIVQPPKPPPQLPPIKPLKKVEKPVVKKPLTSIPSTKKRAGEKPLLSASEKKEVKDSPPLLRKAISPSLLQQLEKNIASLDAKTKSISSRHKEITIPAFIKGLSVDAKVEGSSLFLESSYQDRLIQDLKNNLKLPEYGEVKVRMTISSKGSVVGVEILSSQSEKNKNYLQRELSKMRFLWFSKVISNIPILDFVITFQNEKP